VANSRQRVLFLRFFISIFAYIRRDAYAAVNGWSSG
jgi:hypothetical protein